MGDSLCGKWKTGVILIRRITHAINQRVSIFPARVLRFLAGDTGVGWGRQESSSSLPIPIPQRTLIFLFSDPQLRRGEYIRRVVNT